VRGFAFGRRKAPRIPIGTSADDVLKRWDRALRTRSLGKDSEGFIVECEYRWGFLVFKKGRGPDGTGARCYRVVEIRPREEKADAP